MKTLRCAAKSVVLLFYLLSETIEVLWEKGVSQLVETTRYKYLPSFSQA